MNWPHTDYVLDRMPRTGFDRKYRLFAVAAYRTCLTMYDRHARWLDKAERIADGEVFPAERLPADDRLGGLLIITRPEFTGFEVAWHAAGLVMGCSPHQCRIKVLQERCDAMCGLLRDIFGRIPDCDYARRSTPGGLG